MTDRCLYRLYSASKLFVGAKLGLFSSQSHYLKTVLRHDVGDIFLIFNGTDGEFLARIVDTKNVLIYAFCRAPECIKYSFYLLIPIIKTHKMLIAIDMAIQLGVTSIVPIITERCQIRNINMNRILLIITEALEQSRRVADPSLHDTTFISKYCYRDVDLIICANENETYSNNITNINIDSDIKKIALIVGPEGGLSVSDIQTISSWPNARFINISCNILRTETAVVTLIAQAMHYLK